MVKGPRDGLGYTALRKNGIEKEYSINFTGQETRFFLIILYYNGNNSYIFDNGVEKVKDSEINAGSLCLGNAWKDLSLENMKKTESYGYVYDFSIDYDSTDVDGILDLHQYLMKIHDTK